MYESRSFQVNGHNVEVTATKIQGLNHDLFAKGLVNVVVDGHCLAAGTTIGFEKMADGNFVLIEDVENEHFGLALSYLLVFNTIAVKFIQKTAEMMEFAVFGKQANGEWLNQLKEANHVA